MAPPPPPLAEDFNFHVSSLSAPTSPGRASDFYREFDGFSTTDDEFAFHVSKEAAKCTVSAAELFHGGRIRALRPPPDGGRRGREIIEATTSSSSSSKGMPFLSFASPKSPNSKEDVNGSNRRKTYWCGFTPTWNKQAINPYAPLHQDDDHDPDNNPTRRGRGRESTTSGTRPVRATRSLSPIRGFPPWELDEEDDEKKKKKKGVEMQEASETPAKSNRMQRLKNFLLFRSASEGRASALQKMEAFCKKQNQGQERRMPTSKTGSAHERHYARSKAASDDLKKKTFLPYKRGILLAR